MQAPDGAEVVVKFWGVRGSIASDGEEITRTGGNTACVEIRCGRHPLLFDAGTGLRKAGRALAGDGLKTFDLFLSHSHYDHVIGLPFFAPLFDPEVRCAIWSGHTMGATKTGALVDALLNPLFFPAGAGMFRAEISYRDFIAGEVLRPSPALEIATAQLDHPGGVTGYRVESGGRAVAYLTDTGVRSDEARQACLSLADRADLVIYDCMYTEAEAPERADFGHSTWKDGVDLCERARARRLALFHHAPERDDGAVEDIERLAQARFHGAFAAREGMSLRL
ncbi:MAG: MBL fold metallo-hydrolase [Parvibaculaceae bacterium]